ncbi:hypothetical protein V8E51_019242 [Hyaloscypha variabilis]
MTIPAMEKSSREWERKESATKGTRGLAWCGGWAIADSGNAPWLVLTRDAQLNLWSPPTTALHLNMTSTNPQERLLDTTFENFATSLLPLYSGPQVTIRIGSASHEYKLPKALLYGVVSTQSFQMLV